MFGLHLLLGLFCECKKLFPVCGVWFWFCSNIGFFILVCVEEDLQHHLIDLRMEFLGSSVACENKMRKSLITSMLCKACLRGVAKSSGSHQSIMSKDAA